jgi:hypothetical protein
MGCGDGKWFRSLALRPRRLLDLTLEDVNRIVGEEVKAVRRARRNRLGLCGVIEPPRSGLAAMAGVLR